MKKVGFSLVELLVVIAILCLLLAFLFPVLQSSRKQSYRSTCASNLRQIGSAFKLYEQDFEGIPLHASYLWNANTISDKRTLQCPSDASGRWGSRVTDRYRRPGGNGGMWPEFAPVKTSYIYVRDLLNGEWEDPFNKMNGDNPNPGIFVCQTHGDETGQRYKEASMTEESSVSGWEYTGTIMRLNLDGSVVVRSYNPHPVYSSQSAYSFAPHRWFLFLDPPSKCKACDSGF